MTGLAEPAVEEALPEETEPAADDAVALADALVLMGICGLWLG